MPAGPPPPAASRRAGDVIARRYAVFGLDIASQIELPDLAPGTDAPADVTIRLGTVDSDARGPGLDVQGDMAVLVVPDVARFCIAAGRDMTVEPAPGAAMRDVRLYVLGSAMGAVLHQRGLLPLHANAVGIGNGTVALLGHSGAGKSTLAGWFHDRGHRVLSDDVCVVDPDGRVAPGIPRLRLWRDALEASGRDPGDHAVSYAGADKFDVPIAATEDQPLPLRAIYLLGRAEPTTITPLTGAHAVAALVANTYRGSYVRAAGLAGRHLAACTDLARRVPVFAFDRRWDQACIDADAAVLVAHAQGLAAR
ncbi:MAG: hypothetical protein JWN21_463 [Sphingomonas bacterium]|nr:hypothetical protein [Sphingomonas bacterium]